MQPVRQRCDEYFSTKSKLYNQRKIIMDLTREGVCVSVMRLVLDSILLCTKGPAYRKGAGTFPQLSSNQLNKYRHVKISKCNKTK